MGKPRSLLRTVTAGTAGRLHTCRANDKHILRKGDPILIVKIERDEFHYCLDCATKYIAIARERLAALESELGQAG